MAVLMAVEVEVVEVAVAVEELRIFNHKYRQREITIPHHFLHFVLTRWD
jgi:hypothetical protein